VPRRASGCSPASWFAARAGSASAAVTVDHQHISGNTVVATWNYQVGDVATFVSVVTTEATQDRFATVNILQSNVVTGDVLIASVADVGDFQLSVASDLGTAHFQAQGTFEDDSTFTFFPIRVDLTWTATSAPDRLSAKTLRVIKHDAVGRSPIVCHTSAAADHLPA
jgi:hypothetical protein